MKISGGTKETLADLARDSQILGSITALLDAQLQTFERSMLDLNLAKEADVWALAQRRTELEGARKMRAGLIAYLSSLRKRSE